MPVIMSNYRPVSNLSFVSKLAERAVAKQLNNYVIASDLLQGATTGGLGGPPPPQKKSWTDHPNFLRSSA